jgi:hypothetical protein
MTDEKCSRERERERAYLGLRVEIIDHPLIDERWLVDHGTTVAYFDQTEIIASGRVAHRAYLQCNGQRRAREETIT